MKRYSFVSIILFICVGIVDLAVYGQTEIVQDSSKTSFSYHNSDSTAFGGDTLKTHAIDVSPLDIGGDRGIFILSADRMLQLRILGSIRASINYTDQDMPDHQTFNPFEIPTGIDTKSPNYFAGLQQTRLGFEVTRRTNKRGDVFIRLETDFKNSSNTLRIRHAYGQMGNFLVGQTWTLMNNVSYQPALVSLDGPICGDGLRTPQIRYSMDINNDMEWAAAIEYSAPDIHAPDSIDATQLQVIPNFTGRYAYHKGRISFHTSVVISTISGRIESDDITYTFGYAGSFAGRMDLKKQNQIYMALFAGKATSHFLDAFNGNGQDMAFNYTTGKFEALDAYGSYIAYEKYLPKNLSASLSFGIAAITNKDFQPDDAYSYSYNALINLFWQPVHGARLGIEFANGQRFNKGGSRGMANRLSMLMYYDF